MRELIELYKEFVVQEEPKMTEFKSSGSNRRYFRLSGSGGSVIGTIGTSLEENEAFFYLSELFKNRGLNVPSVLAVSDDRMCYLQQDLGDNTLFDMIERGGDKVLLYERERALLIRTVCQLADFQFLCRDVLDYGRCYPLAKFDRRSVMWDLNYFKYSFLKPVLPDFREELLEDSFEQFATILIDGEEDEYCFMYRDFQSRNVMIYDESPYFIDFQGGRKGPYYYDIASFLWQARANFSQDVRDELLDYYLNSIAKYVEVDRVAFQRRFTHFVLFRLIQVLGAYGFRGYFERKPHFLKSIPLAIENLRNLLSSDSFKKNRVEYPYLFDLLTKLVARFGESRVCQESKMRVTVKSFSFKKRGIPKDEGTNGGGYVFDCRAIHNPGRYEEYKRLSGLDEPVIRFIENNDEMARFLNSVYDLADIHIRRYIERGFTELSFSFGCTGGQHRSVYAAQHFADTISSKYPIDVVVEHLELFPKSIVLAAGLGTRLRPITDSLPKALVPVNGKCMIEWSIDRLIEAGCNRLVITVHHFAEQIIDFVKEKNNFGIDIEFSHERDLLLETGGGIKHAQKYLDGEGHFLVHNCDIFSNVDLKKAYMIHVTSALLDKRVATLIVSKRESSRSLLFDERERLVGWMHNKTGEIKSPYNSIVTGERSVETLNKYAFSGIYVLSSEIFGFMEQNDDGTPFSIIDLFLSICNIRDIVAYMPDNAEIYDMGVI